MAPPYDRLLRQQRFINDHPRWSISAQDAGARFTAERADDNWCYVIAALTLKGLLDRLEEIEARQ